MCRLLIPLLFLIATVFPALPPLLAGQPIEGLVNIKFQLDSRTFALMAAINAAGFDLDSEAVQANPARKLAREHLSRLDSDLRNRLGQFYIAHDREPDAVRQQSKYLSLALALTGPPAFALSVKPNEVPVDAQPIIGFERLVRETWEKGDLEALWDKVRPFYLQEIEIYRPLMRRAILQCLHYLRMEARVSLDRQVVFAPELLSGYGIVNARNIGENYYLLVGPSRVMPRPTHGIRHEYLHFLIDPLITKYADYMPEPSPFLSLVRRRPRAQAHLEKDFPLVVTESLISMLEQRLDNTEDEEKSLQLIDSYERGLILAPYFDDALEKFGRGQESFYEAVPAVLKGIHLEEEKRRPEEIERLRTESDARRAAARAKSEAETGARSEMRGLLVRANEQLLANRYDQARVLLEEVLRRDPDSASALYGLAQLAAREQDLERALSLYARAAAHAADEKWIAAWSHVRRGNIYLFLEDLVSARREWTRVLELQGDLRGAKEAASEALARK